jgi:YVTN family beta-propeller protein
LVALAGQAEIEEPDDPRVEVVVGPLLVFGNRYLGSIEGQKFEDIDGDGVKDPGEPGLNGWVIELYDAEGNFLASTVTADLDLNGNGSIDPLTESGWYQFSLLAWGEYEIREVVPAGWAQTYPSGTGSHAVIVGADTEFVFTNDADFDQGVLFQLNHDAPNNNQLQIDHPILVEFPFINVAASGRGTMVRTNTLTGQVVGEYRTAPEGRGLNPSRTTVDLYGNVWIGNRDEGGYIGGTAYGSVVKIGLVIGGTRGDKNPDGSFTPNLAGEYLQGPFAYSTAVDRDGDGLIRTSGGLGQILAWPDLTDGLGGTDNPAGDARVADAWDEAILIYQRVPDAEQVRHVSVDANNDVWVGGYPFVQRSFHLLDGDTGAIQRSFDARNFGAGGYGGLVDGNGVVWSASISQSRLLRYDPSTGSGAAISVPLSYGLGIDTNGFIWNATWEDNRIVKIAPDGTIQPGFPKPSGGSGARGVAVTPADNHIWVANSHSNTVSRLDNNGNVLKVIGVGSHPTGVAVDSAGKVWVTNLNSSDIMRIDPAGGADGLGAVDLTVSLGAGAYPYNYSDMTGQVVVSSTSPQGTWSVVQDGGGYTQWTSITWNT